MNSLQQLKQYTVIVADTGNLQAIQQLQPQEATTNPTLVTQACQSAENAHLLKSAYQQAKQQDLTGDDLLNRTIDILTVELGTEILKHIDGRVSTEIDAELSYNTQATIDKALQIIELYQQKGIDKNRVLIKIASTWQGIQAAKYLEQQGIHCNLTLLFGLHQAQACADAKVTLISPFVGRILDWYKKHENVESYPIEQDKGVLSVRQIYQYYKQNNIQTQIMGASFRSTEQILALAGCDLLTISPALLQQLSTQNQTVLPQLNHDFASNSPTIQRAPQTEQSFHDELNADPMASELLQQGIDGFIQAKQQLMDLLKAQFEF